VHSDLRALKSVLKSESDPELWERGWWLYLQRLDDAKKGGRK
jgi:hypothetical protein